MPSSVSTVLSTSKHTASHDKSASRTEAGGSQLRGDIVGANAGDGVEVERSRG